MTLETLGSTVIMLIGVAAAWLMRRHLRWAWRLLLLNQGIWLVYGSLTAQWGFVIGAVLYGSGILNNLTGYADILRRWVGLPPTEQPLSSNAELIRACEELADLMDRLGSGDRREVIAVRAAIANARGT